MTTQKHLFQLDDRAHYLNCAYMSPLLKSVEESGIEAMRRKRNPFQIKTNHFFETGEITKQNIAKLIHADASRIAIIPAASYGLATAVANLPLDNGTKALVIGNEFPSGYNEIEKWCRNNQKELQIIAEPTNTNTKGRNWNVEILKNITTDTTVLLISSVHWTDGTRFDLEKIGQKCHENDVVFIVDGTQSVGAVPIDVQKCHIDALVCAAYKWLLGPYSIGFAYYGSRFDNGTPLEESWLNRANAEDFTSLTNYTTEYREGANRYNVGQYSNFILLPMFNESVKQLLDWGINNISSYAENLSKPLISFLENSSYTIEESEYRSKHLFGIALPATIDIKNLLNDLETNNVYVSLRGKSIRISINVFNTEKDISALQNILAKHE